MKKLTEIERRDVLTCGNHVEKMCKCDRFG